MIPEMEVHAGFSMLPPIVSQERFSNLIGVTKATVRGFVETDALPHVKIGRQRFINMVKLVDDLKAGKAIFARGDYHHE